MNSGGLASLCVVSYAISSCTALVSLFCFFLPSFSQKQCVCLPVSPRDFSPFPSASPPPPLVHDLRSTLLLDCCCFLHLTAASLGASPRFDFFIHVVVPSFLLFRRTIPRRLSWRRSNQGQQQQETITSLFPQLMLFQLICIFIFSLRTSPGH